MLIGSNSLAGQAITKSLEEEFQIIPTAGHHCPANGYQLPVEEPAELVRILSQENPEIVVSSVRGDYQAQMRFHKILADWMAGKEKRLLYISTANVFDGNLSRPWTERDVPDPESDYGCFKRDCETMLEELLGGQLIIFRLAAVWSADCPRVCQLKLYSGNREPYDTYPDYRINVTFAEQIGRYAKYVLDHNLHGMFHVATTDTVNYTAFEKKVCEILNIRQPEYTSGEVSEEKILAVVPARKEIPDTLQMTVSDVLSALNSAA